MHKKRKGAALLLVLVLTCGSFFLTASALSAVPVDITRTGTLGIRILDGNGKAVPGGELQLYQVARLSLSDGDMVYSRVNGFENSTVSMDAFLKTGTGAQKLAKELAKDLPRNAKFVSQKLDDRGAAAFSQLELGLYLVVQSKAADRYHALAPFLVSIPIEENAVWVYDVDATPKAGTAAPEETSAPTTAPAAKPTTRPTVPSSSSRLPQTGQLRWPIPILAGGGVVFLLIGWALSKRQERQNENTQ